MKQVTIADKQFELYIEEQKIKQRVAALAQEIEQDYKGEKPLIISVLKGAFIFTSDLVRHMNSQPEIAFTRLKSYDGTSSTGNVTTLMELTTNLQNRNIIVVEDIIDTGASMHAFLPQLEAGKPASIRLASLLSKPDARTHTVDIHYTGFEIPDKFVVGYGLDYNEAGRNLPHIYQLSK